MSPGPPGTDHEEIVPAHPMLFVLVGLSAIGIVAAILLLPWNAPHGPPRSLRIGIAIGAGALPLLVLSVFFRLRIRLSRETLRFAFGPIGHTVPWDSIRLVEAATYRWTEFGGWGIRWGRDGERAYNVPGDGGKAVRIRFVRKGRTYTYLLSCRDPERLAARIRERLPGAAAGGGAFPGSVPTGV